MHLNSLLNFTQALGSSMLSKDLALNNIMSEVEKEKCCLTMAKLSPWHHPFSCFFARHHLKQCTYLPWHVRIQHRRQSTDKKDIEKSGRMCWTGQQNQLFAWQGGGGAQVTHLMHQSILRRCRSCETLAKHKWSRLWTNNFISLKLQHTIKIAWQTSLV